MWLIQLQRIPLKPQAAGPGFPPQAQFLQVAGNIVGVFSSQLVQYWLATKTRGSPAAPPSDPVKA